MAEAAAVLAAVGPAPRVGTWARRGAGRAVAGGAIVLAMALAALAAPWLAPQLPGEQRLGERLAPPAWVAGGSARYPLGTDHLGRDVLSRVMHGARISMALALLAVVVAASVGSALGVLAGYCGGVVDLVVMKVVEVFLSIPFVLLAIVIMTLFGQGLAVLLLVLCLNRWIHYCRVVRGEALSLREREFVQAARALGAGHVSIMLRHILRNTVPSILVVGTFTMATVILLEASLSFLGLGVPVQIPTWGVMLNESRGYMIPAWWTAVFPGLAIFVTILGANLLGDGLRDLMDPRQGQIL
jgi:ABC-type dipeptide/oligopeptide/nickel transport system permease subunit